MNKWDIWQALDICISYTHCKKYRTIKFHNIMISFVINISANKLCKFSLYTPINTLYNAAHYIFLRLFNLACRSLSIPLSPVPAASAWATFAAAAGWATADEGAFTSCLNKHCKNIEDIKTHFLTLYLKRTNAKSRIYLLR